MWENIINAYSFYNNVLNKLNYQIDLNMNKMIIYSSKEAIKIDMNAMNVKFE